jgi:hypothetical protein
MYNFKSALEFDPVSDDEIFLDGNTTDMLDLMVHERAQLIHMFHQNVDEILYTI